MIESLKEEYRSIVAAQLAGEGESAVLHAYEFARKCMRAGLAPDDLVSLHMELVEKEAAGSSAVSRTQALLLEIVVAFSLSYRQTAEELERANRDLEKISSFKTRMLSMVAHDLTNHIIAIKLLVSATLREAREPALRERLSHVLGTVEDQQTLIANLLDMSHIESGKLQLDIQPVSLMEIIGRSVERTRKTTSAHTFKVQGTALQVLADRAKTQQIFENLLGNAVKYSPEGGTISIHVYSAGSSVAVDLQDQGMGISADELPNLFEPFYRGADAERTNIAGTGLGLAIVRSLIDLQKGTIDVESTPGKGSRFRFTLPMAPSVTMSSHFSEPREKK